MQRRTFIASVTTAAVGLAGCVRTGRYVEDRVGDEGTDVTADAEATRSTAIPADRLIAIRDGTLDPQVAEVEVGSLVRWANNDGQDHEITSAQFHDSAKAWDFSSGVLGEGDIVSTNFDEAGVYEYYCSILGKEQLCGVVVVGDAEVPESLPCDS